MVTWILNFATDIVLPATRSLWDFLTTDLSESIPVIGGMSLLVVLGGSALVGVIIYIIIRSLVI